ncbi:hypothetical protein DW671_10480 [Mediterraneibacter gnavus]|nr:hypothetical protein DW671_10480 [Mediterraneibacter gnavus]
MCCDVIQGYFLNKPLSNLKNSILERTGGNKYGKSKK